MLWKYPWKNFSRVSQACITSDSPIFSSLITLFLFLSPEMRLADNSGNGRNSALSANYIVRTIGRIGFATDSQHMRRTREKCHAASVVAARAWQCALSRRESSPGVLRLCIIDPTHGRHNVRGHVSRALTSNWRNKPPRKTAAARVLSFCYTLRGNLHTLHYVIATLYVRTLTFVAVHYNVQSSCFHSYRDFLMFRNVV